MEYQISPDELARLEALKKEVLQKILTKEARERLGRIRVVKPELVAQIELYLLQLYQAGRIKTQITDEQLKEMLKRLASGKEFRIIRR
jgi:programmed cell death protein 5